MDWNICVECGAAWDRHARGPGQFAAKVCDDCFARWALGQEPPTTAQRAQQDLRELLGLTEASR